MPNYRDATLHNSKLLLRLAVAYLRQDQAGQGPYQTFKVLAVVSYLGQVQRESEKKKKIKRRSVAFPVTANPQMAKRREGVGGCALGTDPKEPLCFASSCDSGSNVTWAYKYA